VRIVSAAYFGEAEAFIIQAEDECAFVANKILVVG
jgi:hypothetical protein